MSAAEFGEPGHMAPVIPIFGASRQTRALEQNLGQSSLRGSGSAQPTSGPGAAKRSRLDSSFPSDDSDQREQSALDAHAEQVLVRRLRARQLSVHEARAVLAEEQMSPEGMESLIDDFCQRLYLDDRALAGHLVWSGMERKGQGRALLARTLSQRGIPREIADEVLDEISDSEEHRALEFARSRARGMRGVEPEAALRRLAGQLARRGFGGSAGFSAARTALLEEGVLGGGRSKFEEGKAAGPRTVQFREAD